MEALAHFKLLNNFVLTSFLFLLISSCNIPIPKDVVNIDELPLKTALKISSSTDIVYPNDSVSFTAQVVPKKIINNQPPSGSITFIENETPLCSEIIVDADSHSASCTTQFLIPGAHTIFATYSGDDFYIGSTSDPFIQNISGKIVVKTELDISPNTPATIGGSVTLEANLIPDYLPVKMTGTLSFKDGETVIESCQFNDITKIENLDCPHIMQTAGKYEFSAKYTPKISGEHNFFVTYTGDVTYFDSQSEIKKISVNQINTSMVLSTQDGDLVRSSQVKLIAKLPLNLYEPKGTVSFYDNEIAVQNCSAVQLKVNSENYSAECTVGKLTTGGTHSFKAKFSGDINNRTATAVTSRYVLIPTKSSVEANPKNLWVGKDFVLKANIEASDNIPDPNISGNASFYDGAQILSGCANLNVTNGKVECSVAQFSEPKSHSFSIQFNDKNTLKKYVFSLSPNYVASIDTQIPNSAIYLVTGAGKVSISTNGGRSWVDTKTQPTKGTDKALNLFVTPIGDIYIGASDGNIYYSTDNGNVWNVLLPKINEPGSVIKALFINPNHELFVDVTLLSSGAGSIRKLKLNDPSRKWETLLPNFLVGSANAIVTFASPHTPKDTKLIVARNDNRFYCFQSDTGGALTNFQKEFTSMSLGGTSTGSTLYLGTNTGEIYFLKDLNTSDFCAQEKERVPVVLSSGTLGGLAVKGLSVVSNTIYAIVGSKVAISLDNGAHWEFRDTSDGAAANAIFVTPVLYAVAGSRISEQTDIQISKDSGKSWYSLKDNIGETSDRVSLDTFFVTSQDGFLFTIFEGDGSTQMRTSTNGGLTWENREEFKSRYNFKASSLWVDTISDAGNRNSLNMNKLKFVVGYENGGLGLSTSGMLRPLYDICTNPPPSDDIRPQSICRVNSIQSSAIPNVVLTAAYPYSLSNNNSNGMEYFDINSLKKLEIPMDPFPVHSLAVNPMTNEWYASTKPFITMYDEFTTPYDSVIRKSIDGGGNWMYFRSYPYSGLPINLFTTPNGTLYVSFVSSIIPTDSKNAKIYITTDDGNTWEQLTNQPYSGSQAASLLFAQYQYN